MESIKEGDVITIEWSDGSESPNCKVLSMPQDTGDLLYVENELVVMGINTNGSGFRLIYKIK